MTSDWNRCPDKRCSFVGSSEEDVTDHIIKMARHNLHESQASDNPQPFCIGCYRIPEEIDEYSLELTESGLPPSQYVRLEEGTYNSKNGHFLCTECYIKAGAPTSPRGWKAP